MFYNEFGFRSVIQVKLAAEALLVKGCLKLNWYSVSEQIIGNISSVALIEITRRPMGIYL